MLQNLRLEIGTGCGPRLAQKAKHHDIEYNFTAGIESVKKMLFLLTKNCVDRRCFELNSMDMLQQNST